jgi:hypothetical protein
VPEDAMNMPLIDVLAERVERLERQNRRWKRLSGLVLLSAVLMIFGGARFASEPKVIEAERFVLRAKNGKMRADLRVTPEDLVGFVLFDQDERQRVGMAVYPNRIASLKLLSDTDKTRATLFMQGDGAGGFNLFRDDKLRGVMGMDQAGTIYLQINDQHEKPVFEAPRP